MEKIIIFGSGEIAQLASYYFEIDSEYEVVAFTADLEFIGSNIFEGKPLIPFEEIVKNYPPSDYKMFIAISYADMNRVREQKYIQAKKNGYELVSYISSKCSYLSQFDHGDNCFILEDNTIQPFVKIGNCVTLWSGNHIGHHSEIQDHNFVSSHVVISGHCIIENNCFLGVNATIGHDVKIGIASLIGAGASIVKNVEPKSVIVPAKSIKLPKSTDLISI